MSTVWSVDLRALPAMTGDPPVPVLGLLCLCDGKLLAAQALPGPQVADGALLSVLAGIEDEHGASPGWSSPSAGFAARLGRLLPDCTVAVVESPGLDRAFTGLAEHLDEAELDGFAELDHAVRGALLDALEAVLQAKPWAVVPADAAVRITCRALGMEDGRISVLGHAGASLGLLLFDSGRDHDLFRVLSASASPELTELPRITSLTAELVAVPEGIAGVDDEHQPNPDVAVVEGQHRRAPTDSEAQRLTLAATALCRFVTDESAAIVASFDGGDQARGSYSVAYGDYEVDVVVETVPAVGRPG